MHTMNGHVHCSFKEMIKSVRAKRKDCKWQRRVRNFKQELSEWKRESQEARPITDGDEALKRIVTILRGRVTRARNKLYKLDAVDFPTDRQIAMIEEANEELERVTGELEEAKQNRRENASSSKGSIWHWIECGIDHLEETVDECTAEDSILPGDDLEFSVVTFV